MTYSQILNKLDRLSVSASVAPDARRLCVDAALRMRAAKTRPVRTSVRSAASYCNLYGEYAQTQMRLDKAAAADERRQMMAAAQDDAEQLLVAWSL